MLKNSLFPVQSLPVISIYMCLQSSFMCIIQNRLNCSSLKDYLKSVHRDWAPRPLLTEIYNLVLGAYSRKYGICLLWMIGAPWRSVNILMFYHFRFWCFGLNQVIPVNITPGLRSTPQGLCMASRSSQFKTIITKCKKILVPVSARALFLFCGNHLQSTEHFEYPVYLGTFFTPSPYRYLDNQYQGAN